MKIRFQILRQSASASPHFQDYELEVAPTTTILDCLNQIKWEMDGSLAFRKNCRNTICGSCAMGINGRSALACKENVGQELQRLGLDPEAVTADAPPTIAIAPLGNMPVIKDLVVDMGGFWDNLEQVEPYVSSGARRIPEREFLQTPEERSQLDQMGNCILCGACYSECNAKEVNPQFVGPHALAKGARLVKDNRDDRTEERLEQYNNTENGVWGCTRCYLCNEVCPLDVAPLDQISKIKGEILQRQDKTASRAVRHRKTLVTLVKAGGWIDERKFAVMVYQNLSGLLSLAPLGWKLLARGKMPLTFEPSEGTAQVRSLMERVERFEAAGAKGEGSSPEV